MEIFSSKTPLRGGILVSGRTTLSLSSLARSPCCASAVWAAAFEPPHPWYCSQGDRPPHAPTTRSRHWWHYFHCETDCRLGYAARQNRRNYCLVRGADIPVSITWHAGIRAAVDSSGDGGVLLQCCLRTNCGLRLGPDGVPHTALAWLAVGRHRFVLCRMIFGTLRCRNAGWRGETNQLATAGTGKDKIHPHSSVSGRGAVGDRGISVGNPALQIRTLSRRARHH